MFGQKSRQIDDLQGEIERLHIEYSAMIEQEVGIRKKETAELKAKICDLLEQKKGISGEYYFHQQMKNLLNSEEYPNHHFFSNIFFPRENDKGAFVSQIDHLLICPSGIYLFNTKSWNGVTVIFAESQNEDKITRNTFAYLTGGIIPSYKGLSIINSKLSISDNKKWECHLNTYGNPVSDIIFQANDFRKYLTKQLEHLESLFFIFPVLNFLIPTEPLIESNTLIQPNIYFFFEPGHAFQSKVIPNNGELVKVANFPLSDDSQIFALSFERQDEPCNNLRKFMGVYKSNARNFKMEYTPNQIEQAVNFILTKNLLADKILYCRG